MSSHSKTHRIREHFDQVHDALRIIIRHQEVIMSGQANLDAALSTLAQQVNDLDAAVQTGIAALLAAKNNGDDAAFQAAADRLATLSAKIAGDTSGLLAAEAPAPTPAPAPAPAPADPMPAPAAPAPAAPAG